MATADRSLVVQGVEVHLTTRNEEDYISLTDMASRFEGSDQQIKNWLQNRGTIDFLAVWEQINNPSFNLVGFHQIRSEAASQRFIMSVKKWGDLTSGTGIIARAGRYGGTFAHKDIAFEFGSWLSPEFKLYLITEFQRLKQSEAARGLDWDVRRTLSKVQYRVHTDAVKEHLVPNVLSAKDAGFVYASEADLLNKALFGMTAAEWKKANPGAKGNLRDSATMEQLVVMSSLESQNALLIQQQVPQGQRLGFLNTLARAQLQSLLNNPSLPPLRGGPLLGH
jgi:hypothetical protein